MDVVDLTFSDDEDKNFVDLTMDGDEGHGLYCLRK